MKIEQQPKFQPITITLETADEANIFRDLLENVNPGLYPGLADHYKMARDLNNWFSNNAQLGG